MKGFVFIFGNEVIPRFVESGAFNVLERRHELVYVVPGPADGRAPLVLNGQEASTPRTIMQAAFYPERDRRWDDLFELSCLVYQDRSSSFAVRVQERSKADPKRFSRLTRLARSGRYAQYRERLKRTLGLHPDLLALTARERPDFFILPSRLRDCFTEEVLQLAEHLQIPTLLLVSGWDTLSSKGILHHHPTLVGCWGEQAKRHATQVQGIDPRRVELVGAPHYERFHRPPLAERIGLRASLGLPREGRVVLFAGSLRPFDETRVLQELERAIETGRLPALHVLYRPHPWRGARRQEASYFDFSWRHVTMDPQLIDVYQATKREGARFIPDNFLYDLDHLNRVYHSVDAVMSPMSTVLLETLIMGLPAMAVAFGDGKHSWSPEKVSRMLHFKELYEVPGLLVCRSADALLDDLNTLLAQVDDARLRHSHRLQSRYFVYHDERAYAQRVADLVDRMLAETAQRPAYETAGLKPGRRFRLQSLWRRTAARTMWGRRRVTRQAIRSAASTVGAS